MLNFIKRIFNRTDNILKISTLSEQYSDRDEKILHSSFQLLVDFVEIELASHQLFCDSYNKKYNFIEKINNYFRSLFFIRSRELGLKHLELDMKVPATGMNGCPGQAKYARQIKELYLWWKDIYLKRQDPMEASGLSKFYDKYRSKIMLFRESKTSNDVYESYNTLTPEEEKQYHKLLDTTWKLEEDYIKDENKMLIKLIKIRKCLWS